MANALERAHADAERFLRQHPEFRREHEAPRLPNGETNVAERANIGGVSRVAQAYGSTGQLTDIEDDRGFHMRVVWPPAREESWWAEMREDLVRSTLAAMKPDQAELLVEYYFEGQTYEEMAKARRTSWQAVQQRVRTAEAAFTRTMAKEG